MAAEVNAAAAAEKKRATRRLICNANYRDPTDTRRHM